MRAKQIIKGIARILPDSLYIRIAFFRRMRRFPNLKNPKTFNEKLQWLKLHDRNPLYTELVDKYRVRKHIADTVGEEYLIPLVGGPWNSFDEINFDKLPNQFVLKCNHDSGGLVVCRDKSKLDIKRTQEIIECSLRTNYFWQGREWPYKYVKPCIIAEQFLEDTVDDALTDYKFFCFNGKPKIMYISKDRGREPRTDFFDMDYNPLPIRAKDPNSAIKPEKPALFEEMKKLAESLSKNIPHLRVDFYIVNNRIYVGELTFYHSSGMIPISPAEWDLRMGEWICLPDYEK